MSKFRAMTDALICGRRWELSRVIWHDLAGIPNHSLPFFLLPIPFLRLTPYLSSLISSTGLPSKLLLPGATSFKLNPVRYPVLAPPTLRPELRPTASRIITFDDLVFFVRPLLLFLASLLPLSETPVCFAPLWLLFWKTLLPVAYLLCLRPL